MPNHSRFRFNHTSLCFRNKNRFRKKPRKSKTKKEQTTQEDTVIEKENTGTEKIETQKTEEIQPVKDEISQNQTQKEQETNLAPKETQTTQTVEPEKSDALKRVEAHRQKVQAQKAAQATTEIKSVSQTKTKDQQETQASEEREFGKLPKGKIWSELPEDLKETIRKEKQELRYRESAERRERSLQDAITGTYNEVSKMHHNPHPKPPGHWNK